MQAFVTSRVRNYAMTSFDLAILSPHILVVIPQNNEKIETKLSDSTKLNA
jgi:hypothetical protein